MMEQTDRADLESLLKEQFPEVGNYSAPRSCGLWSSTTTCCIPTTFWGAVLVQSHILSGISIAMKHNM